jgi:hypothetical protein
MRKVLENLDLLDVRVEVDTIKERVKIQNFVGFVHYFE